MRYNLSEEHEKQKYFLNFDYGYGFLWNKSEKKYLKKYLMCFYVVAGEYI